MSAAATMPGSDERERDRMSTITDAVRRVIRRKPPTVEAIIAPVEPAPQPELPAFDIEPDDPLLAFFATSSGAVAIDSLELDSPALTQLREAGVKMVVPLVSQGELIGLLNLGPRLSERDYSSDDRKLLDELATHAAPAIRVAQLVREQEAEAQERERVHQELRVAQLIQQQFLPSELPDLPGWRIAAYYQPAREVGGDFYDFIPLPDGKIGMIVGDVTDKGVPAALVMATTHSLLRAEAPRLLAPGAVLERVNELLVEEMPPNMFVTCLYAVLDPATGTLQLANAGHNLPYVATDDGPVELLARGLPLGLMPGMEYEEVEAVLAPGQSMLLHSDGLAEAHNAEREMFGFPRLLELVGIERDGQALIDLLLGELGRFTDPGAPQEDDITLVTLQRSGLTVETLLEGDDAEPVVLAEFDVPSEPGNERVVMERIAAAVSSAGIAPAQLERLKTAVAEATMNAIEHGNGNDPDLPVEVRLLASGSAIKVLITDLGGEVEAEQAELPDIEAKLAGLQSPRGWGLFLIRSMVDEMTTTSDGARHTIELTLYTEGESNAIHSV
jgi:serine phosphatase RsbU (regulator of sigma subunit)/anti-sigma regulatory factor (Ser/Thr protein kinase)